MSSFQNHGGARFYVSTHSPWLLLLWTHPFVIFLKQITYLLLLLLLLLIFHQPLVEFFLPYCWISIHRDQWVLLLTNNQIAKPYLDPSYFFNNNNRAIIWKSSQHNCKNTNCSSSDHILLEIRFKLFLIMISSTLETRIVKVIHLDQTPFLFQSDIWAFHAKYLVGSLESRKYDAKISFYQW